MGMSDIRSIAFAYSPLKLCLVLLLQSIQWLSKSKENLRSPWPSLPQSCTAPSSQPRRVSHCDWSEAAVKRFPPRCAFQPIMASGHCNLYNLAVRLCAHTHTHTHIHRF